MRLGSLVVLINLDAGFEPRCGRKDVLTACCCCCLLACLLLAKTCGSPLAPKRWCKTSTGYTQLGKQILKLGQIWVLVLRNALKISVEERLLALEMCLHGYGVSEGGARGAAAATPAGRDAASAGHAAAPARRASGGRTPHGPRTPRRRPPQQQQWAGRARSTAPTPTPPTPTPAPPSRTPPSPSPRGGSGTSAPRRASARRRASRCRNCKGSGTPGEWSRKGAAAGGRGAADGATGRGQGRGQGTGRACRGAGREPRCRGRGEGRWESERARAWWTGGGTRDTGRGPGRGQGTGRALRGAGRVPRCMGAGRGGMGERAGQGVGDERRDPRHGHGTGKWPKGKGKGAAGPKGQAGRGMGAQGGGRGEGRGAEGGAPPQPDVQPVRCIPPGIQQMPAHHTHHHHHHHHHLYNIDPDAGELVPPQPPRHQHQQAPPAPRAEPARMASAEVGRDAASAPQAQGQRGGPARGAEEGRPWDRDWGAVPDPLGGETLPLVGEVYGWLCWANQGTSRRSRNRPFDAVLLRRDGGNGEAPPGGWAAPEDHERVLRPVIRAAWPDREPTWPAFLEEGAVLRITDADANNWLPRALRSALAHWRYRRHNPPPPQPQPPHKRRRK